MKLLWGVLLIVAATVLLKIGPANGRWLPELMGYAGIVLIGWALITLKRKPC